MNESNSKAGRLEMSVEETHLALLQAIPEGICFKDVYGAIRFWNHTAEEISGFSVAEAVCARHSENIFSLSGQDGQPVSVAPVSAEDRGFSGNFSLRHKDGHFVPVTVRQVAVQSQSDSPMGLLYLFQIPEGALIRAEARRKLADQSRPIWLQNKTPDAEELSQQSRPTSIVLIQIDDFEEMSQRLGPEATKKLVTMVDHTTAYCLADGDSCQVLPDGVILASLGKTSGRQLAVLAEKIRALIQSARIQWWGNVVEITVTIGVAEVHPNDAVADSIGRAGDCVSRSRIFRKNHVVQA